jgi:hypothetical protein
MSSNPIKKPKKVDYFRMPRPLVLLVIAQRYPFIDNPGSFDIAQTHDTADCVP